ncbi:MAG: dTDP-4-amino-4,6-dideoxygalactose transaminase [Chloroflexi bacterium]|jgi:dTDP-4-amino-4,6-dideoxygalactose transaminase|nr:dTDP-4-amino-4,6-dideoxygalactose transaminase [Chloroflexota bacterium]
MIDFNKPTLVGNECEYISHAFDNSHVSGDGEFSKKCHTILEETLGVPRALLTTNCTHALEMTALLLDIQPGDEVIVPSFTFVSTVNAFVLRGARPVFSDIRPDTLNIDENHLESLITPRTRAIVVVHYAGVGCEMDSILAIAARHGIPVVEDNAHGLFGRYKGRYLGTFGSLATQSFHETKNMSCGEGGAILINDPALVDRAEIIREKGTNRSRFFRGMVDKYTWVDAGSSYLLSDILAAVLYAQLEKRDEIQSKRQHVWEYYDAQLRDWTVAHGIQAPSVPEYCQQSYHMYYLLLPDLETRSALIKYLKQRQIISVFHYLPLHLSDMGRKYGYSEGACPVTERVSDQLVRLPFHNSLSDADQDQVVAALKSFMQSRA